MVIFHSYVKLPEGTLSTSLTSLVKQDSFQVESDQKKPSGELRPPAKMEHQRSKPPTLALKKRAWIMHPSSVVVGNLIYIIYDSAIQTASPGWRL